MTNFDKVIEFLPLGTAQSINGLGILYCTQGKFSDAEPLFKRAFTISEKMLGLAHPDTLRCLYNYTIVLRKMNKNAEASALEAKARTIMDNLQKP